jgi:hypothetical protein
MDGTPIHPLAGRPEIIFDVLINAKGQRVPVVAVSEDEPAVVSAQKALMYGSNRLCATCGGPMGELAWFVLKGRAPVRFGPNGRRHIHFLEMANVNADKNPPMHLECARLTVGGGCPFMSRQPTTLAAVRSYTWQDNGTDWVFSGRIVEMRRK